MQLENANPNNTPPMSEALKVLQESNGLLPALIENLPGGAVFVVDRDLRYLLAQGEALSAAGFKPKDFVGQTILEALPPELATKYEGYYRQALAGEPFEMEHTSHNHTYITRGTPLRSIDGEVYAVLAVSYDISDRKRREEYEVFLLKLSDALRPLSDPLEIQQTAMRVLGDYLKVDRILYAEIEPNDEYFVIADNYVRGNFPKMIGRFPLSDFGKVPKSQRVGEMLVAPDIKNLGESQAHLAAYLAAGLRAIIGIPLCKDGRWVASLTVHHGSPRQWTPEEVAFVSETAERTWAAVERARAEESLHKSEAKYRSLINSIDEGFCIIERVKGESIDFRYIEANPAFAVQTGISDVVGKTIRETFPDAPEAGYETYENVLKTGEPIQFEIDVPSISRILEIYAFRIDDEPCLAVIFKDITDRKRSEAQLRRAADMDAFRVKLSDALRFLADPTEIQAEAMHVLGEYLGAVRAQYWEAEPDGSHLRSGGGYAKDKPRLSRRIQANDFGVHFIEAFAAGRTVAIADVALDPHASEAALAAYDVVGVRAYIGVPLVKSDRLIALLGVHRADPHDWTKEEIALAEETAERTWAAVERSRAEEALRESEIQRVREQAAREEERQRAESLAELDRAKTIFFSNISHEFRTPLTLLLAPLSDALESVEAIERGGTEYLTLSPSAIPTLKEHLQLARRNSLRLLKLVNTLLDFSRLEAGRIEAVYEPTDLAQLTTDLASVFRSAIERAGLRLIVDCPPLSEPVYIDREMWEKIVLNLLSNALKFTFSGEITVSLHPNDTNQAILEVRDTGGGIAPEHLPHLFERFYQVRGTQARTHEGSGIGLALVQELVQLQGGALAVRSTLQEGTCFTISLPFGTDHLPSDRIQATHILASTALNAASYVKEVEQWLPQESKRGQKESVALPDSFLVHSGSTTTHPPNLEPQTTTPASSAHVLLVDDNFDMREYLTRILSDRVHVEAVADVASALSAIQVQMPDLVLSDVMMPGLDGFSLLQTLRANLRTRELPIILLSARAGVEAIVEGLEAGADDYLIKPFSTQELVSRVNAHLQMAHLRKEALHEARTTISRKDELLSIVSHELNAPLVSILGWTRLLRSNPPSPSMLTKALATIERNATLQAKLVQDLLDLSLITTGKLRLNPQLVELESVVETAIASVHHLAQEKEIALRWDVPGQKTNNPVVVMGDRDRLEQVLYNLLTNAIKFTPAKGSVTVELSEIDDRNSIDAASAQIRVTDTGIGISSDFLPHVFERFRQAEGPIAAKGLGLGLAIAQHLVELHDGTIDAQSDGVGQGATFIVRLPLVTSHDQ